MAGGPRNDNVRLYISNPDGTRALATNNGIPITISRNARDKAIAAQKRAEQLNAIKSQKANKQIDELLADYNNEDIILSYLKAINNRNRKSVLALDKRNSDAGYDSEQVKENKKRIREVRRTLLDISRYSPEEISKILEGTKAKINQRVQENRKKIDSLPDDVKRKLEHDIGNMNIGHYSLGYYADTIKTLADQLGIPTSGKSILSVNDELEHALGRKIWQGDVYKRENMGRFK